LVTAITVYRVGVGLDRLLIQKMEASIICAGSSVQQMGKVLEKKQLNHKLSKKLVMR